MGFGHEKLDVYHAAIEYVGWVYRYCETMKGHRGYVVNEESAQYSVDLIDPDLSYIAQRATEDTDPDTDKSRQWQFPRITESLTFCIYLHN